MVARGDIRAPAPPGGWGVALAIPTLLGLVHGAVDAASGIVLGRALPTLPAEQILLLFLLYDACAFALQPLFGLASDGLRRPRLVAAGGLVLVAASLPLAALDPSLLGASVPWIAVAVTGLGNAAFHIGAGVVASASTPGGASGAGVFIGPGALGLVLGQTGDPFGPLGAILLAALAAGVVVVLLVRPGPGRWPDPGETSAPRARAVVVVALLAAVAIRGLGGFTAVGGAAGLPGAMWTLAVAACAGKMLGGVLADLLGWLRVCAVSLVVAAVLFAVQGESLWLAAAGVVLFQFPTGVTLGGLYRVWPGRLGLAFGLACLALFIGGLPVILQLDVTFLAAPLPRVLLTLLAAGLIVVGLVRSGSSLSRRT